MSTEITCTTVPVKSSRICRMDINFSYPSKKETSKKIKDEGKNAQPVRLTPVVFNFSIYGFLLFFLSYIFNRKITFF